MEPHALRKTPLDRAHRRLGARMVPFAGFEMPLQYTGIIEEHMAVRTAAGVFDISHMGEIVIEGVASAEWIHTLLTNRTQVLEPGRAQYNLMLNERGGIVDDLIVYRLSPRRWMLVVNAVNIEKDFAWIRDHAPSGVRIVNESEAIALLAVQGPRAEAILNRLVDVDLSTVRYYRFVEAYMGSISVLCSRTGYTGEDGFEVFCAAEEAEAVWDRILEVGETYGLKPCGLGARDTLRLEAGMRLYGRDMNEDTTPFEVGLGWVVKMDKGEFIGRWALVQMLERGIPRKMVGFVMVDEGIPRHSYALMDADGRIIGHVTSGTFAPYLKKALGMGLVSSEYASDTIWVEIRRSARRALLHPLPFYSRSRRP